MPLSIGLEFEAVVTSLHPPAPIPVSSIAQLRIVADAMKSSGVPAKVFAPQSTRESPDYSVWNVVMDATIEEVSSQSDASNSALLSRFGVEVVSPTFYETEWKKDIKLALDAVAARVSWKANRFTGLHVHVGRGKDVFTLPELKRIAIMVCRFESALDNLHPVRRITDNPNILSNRFNPALKDLSLPQVYARILETTDVPGLAAVMNYVPDEDEKEGSYDGNHDLKFFKVNFTSLVKHHTVEFRQHEGTVSSDSTIHWTEFVIRFVDYAISATDGQTMAEGETLEHLRSLVTLPNQNLECHAI